MDLIKPPARKGDKNRVRLNTRIDERTFEIIQQLAKEWNKSQGEIIDAVIDTWAEQARRGPKEQR